MEWQKLEENFSSQRVGRYLVECQKDHSKATQAYLENVKLTSSLIPMLHFFEVALRNRLHRQLKQHFSRDDWWESDALNDVGHEIRAKIEKAKDSLTQRMEAQTVDKIVAELSLGFWTTLLNAKYQDVLWGPIRKAFKNLPKNQKQRANVSAPLNKVRDLRNRAFHHEPLLWLRDEPASEVHRKGIEVISWLDKDLADWLQQSNDFEKTWDSLDSVKGYVRSHKAPSSKAQTQPA